MSPLELHILLWIYARPQPVESLAPLICPEKTIREFVGNLERDGLIVLNQDQDTEQRWMVTERGEVYIEALRELPFPEQKWVMP